jgi:uncharacterized membrane protein YczE
MLLSGLALYGLSSGLILQAGLGLDPWDVLHQGLARTFGGQVGTWAILASVAVLLLWLPLRSRFGLGTLLNAVLVGLCMNLTVWLVPTMHELALQAVLLVTGVALNAFATGLYIGAGFGPGPRDGLTTAIAARGHSIRLVRTAIEATVLVAGWLLGGSVGVGTVLYAAAIGPLTHLTIPWLTPTTRSGCSAEQGFGAGRWQGMRSGLSGSAGPRRTDPLAPCVRAESPETRA